MAQNRPEISALIICFNEENNIRGCLESLKWCDEIVVVDSFSTDRTLEICREYTQRVFQRPWAGYRDQKAFAHTQATRDWVIWVDADERVPPELKKEIQDTLSRCSDRYTAFKLPRLVYYLGRWWWRGGWYPDYNIRVFQRDRARWGGLEPHGQVFVDGRTRRLKNPLHHYSYRDITDHLQRINQFTTVSLEELKDKRKQGLWIAIVFRAAFRFFRFYVLKRGFLEGLPGFFVAVTAAIYVFLKYAKLIEFKVIRAAQDRT